MLARSNIAQMAPSVYEVLFSFGCAFVLHVFLLGIFRLAALGARVAALEERVQQLEGDVQQLEGGVIHLEDDVLDLQNANANAI